MCSLEVETALLIDVRLRVQRSGLLQCQIMELFIHLTYNAILNRRLSVLLETNIEAKIIKKFR